jgi:hypothetical protein
MGDRTPGVSPNARGGAHCKGGWMGKEGCGEGCGRGGGVMTTKKCLLSAIPQSGCNTTAARMSRQHRMQEVQDIAIIPVAGIIPARVQD